MKKSRLCLFLLTELLLAGAAFAACLPSYTFNGGTNPDAAAADPDAMGGTDAPAEATDGSKGDASTDAPTDAPTTFDAAITPFTVVPNAGPKALATGFGQQRHAFFAAKDQSYWILYDDDTTGSIRASHSKDLVTWATNSISLGGTGYVANGNNFAVAYAGIGGNDLVHIVANVLWVTPERYQTVHIRGAIESNAFVPKTAPTSPLILPDINANGGQGTSGAKCPLAGPSSIIAKDGRVYDVTAWTGHDPQMTACDTNIYRSSIIDNGGTTWPASLDHNGYFAVLPKVGNGHELVEVSPGKILALWPNRATVVGAYETIGWALSTDFAGGGPMTIAPVIDPTTELFYSAALPLQSGYNDWASCRLTDTDLHVIRHTVVAAPATNDFQEVRYNGTSWTPSAVAPPAVPGVSNTGVVLLSDTDPTHGMLLVSIGADNLLYVSKWTTAGGWKPISTLGAAERHSLTGTGCGSVHPQVYWTEGTGPYAIKGADLSALLLP